MKQTAPWSRMRYKTNKGMKQLYKLLILFTMALTTLACRNNNTDLQAEIAIPVSVEDVTVGPIEKFINTTGTVYPLQEVEIKSEISGDYTLRKNPRSGRNYTLGDLVRKGEVLITIEDAEYRNNIKLEAQKLNLEISKQTLEKQRSLYEKGGVSQLDLKNAEIEAVNAEYAYQSALIQLSRMRVEAPFEGSVVDILHNAGGARLEPGVSLLKIMNFQKLYLDVNFPEKNLSVIEEGLPVRITHYTLPDDTIFGKISAISPSIDPDTRTFKCNLVLDNPDLKFRPGMFVKADLVIARKDSAIVVPKDIILSKQRGKTVYIVERGAARERVIETGLENPYEVEVVKGLTVNDRLVVKGFETLTDQSRVTIVK